MWQARAAWIPLPVRHDVDAGRWRDIACVAGIVALLGFIGHSTNGFQRFETVDIVMPAMSLPASWTLVYQLQPDAAARPRRGAFTAGRMRAAAPPPRAARRTAD